MTSAHTTLPAQASSVPIARHFVRTSLEGLGCLAAYEAAEMLVSEIATNAVLHAKTEFTVEVTRSGDTVRVSVMDLSRAIPKQRTYGPDSTTGRGLRLVDSLSSAWGVDRTAAGKTVWFEVPAAGDGGRHFDAWDDEDVDVDALLAGFDDLDSTGPPQAPTARQAPFAPRALRAAS